MNCGVDTGFLIAAEIVQHEHREWALTVIDSELSNGNRFSIAPQVVAEFMHVVTDPKRFTRALAIEDAQSVASKWWSSPFVDHALLDAKGMSSFFRWHKEHRLGRKRILDTMLASTYYGSDVRKIVTTNPSDFGVFGVFEIVHPPK